MPPTSSALNSAALDADWNPADCNCLALRQAARHVTQFYDQHMAKVGLRSTQYSILSRLNRRGPMSINTLAAEMVMDRTTLGRNILPLEREGLVEIRPDENDRRSKAVLLSKAGTARWQQANKRWKAAQQEFESGFGGLRSAQMRDMLRGVVATELAA
ncbi:MAG TPA: MarR family winged helix-turn-helix transcriptional regulator [Burkholderiales bacterium]